MKTTLANVDMPNEMKLMFEEVLQAGPLFYPSRFWDELGAEHVQQINEFGLQYLKRTVNMRYFNWSVLGILAHQMIPLTLYWLRSANLRDLNAELINASEGPESLQISRINAKIYAIFVSLLFRFVERLDSEGLLPRVKEPNEGLPYLVKVGNGSVTSQDACNSIHEYYRSTINLGPAIRPLTVLEIGAGYGRIAPVFLTARQTKYWIVDVPPALYISQSYLSQVYPNRKIFKFRPFKNFDEVKDEVMEADICFFSSNQLPSLPRKSVDLVICISNLHEMSIDQINFYFDEIDRCSRGYFYTKQWLKSRAQINGFTIRRGEYPVKPSWTQIYDIKHPVQSWFFEALYRVEPSASYSK